MHAPTASGACLALNTVGKVVATVPKRLAVPAARPSARRAASTVNSAFGPTPTSSTAPAANRSPLRAVTSRCSPFLPVSLAPAYASAKPISRTPGPGAGPWNTGTISNPVRISPGASLE